MNGRSVVTQPQPALTGENLLRLDVTGLPPGMYFVRVTGEDWRVTERVIVR